MDDITLIDFTEFEQENMGNADKYIGNKEINEQIHIRNNNPNEIFTESDWGKDSNHFISHHVWDVAHGEFITLGNLQIEMNNIENV